MIRTIIWFIYFFAYLLVATPLWLYCNHKIKKGERAQVQPKIEKMVYNWANRLIKLAGGEIEVVGQENIPEGTAVFVSNHQSDFDIPTVLTVTGKPRALMAKKSLAKIPGIHGWMNHLQCVFLDRDNEVEAVQALREAIRLVKNGNSITIFPEGTRSKGGPVKEFKGGAFRIATSTKTPIVPITIDGTYRMLEQPGYIHPAKVKVTIHKPIETAGMSRQEVRDLPERVRQQVMSALPEA